MASTEPHDAGSPEWHAGVASRSITPTSSMWMAGFGFREGPSEGVERDLEVKALAIQDRAGNRVVILSAELLFVTEAVREQVLAGVDLADDELLINATHTHCGPEYRRGKLDMYADDPAHYRELAAAFEEELVEALQQTVDEAMADLAPATLSFDHARSGFAMNRRRPTADGIAHVPNPDGPVDHDVPVLAVRRDGSIAAVVFGYTCHPTSVIRCDGWMRFNGDWAGYAQAELESAYSEATAIFIQGCAGEQNAYPRGSLSLARHHGRAVANAVSVAVDASRTAVRGPLRTLLAEQPIELQGPPEEGELRELRSADDPVDRVRAEQLLDERDETGTIDTTRSLPIQGIGFGDDLALLGLGGEVLVEYGIELKRYADVPCWVVGYSNTGFTYVPTKRAIVEGGYEGKDAFRYAAWPGPPKPSIENRVLRRSKAVIDRVAGPQ